MRFASLLLVLSLTTSALGQTIPTKGNRFAYLDEGDPYYPHRDFARLITPQWVGEDGVEAVVVLAIDDMRDAKKYETYLRPILDRLKEIDGRAAVSIMTCSIDPKEPHLQKWLKEGLSLECHTFDHPCPFFKNGFDKGRETYGKCVKLLGEVPGNTPVAFRMPCCDSMNTPSPRFYANIFNIGMVDEASQKTHQLRIDSSVFNVFTSADAALPRDLVLDEKGLERFRKYLPADRSFVNTIENYPYPYLIGGRCWQFPCVTPSDWQAQHLHKPNNPRTVEDWKAALDCTVVKQGVFCMVFHPHGWIKSEQVVDFIDHAVQKHGKKVKFLTFREAFDRLAKSIYEGTPPAALDLAHHVLDVNGDGCMDVIRRSGKPAMRLWSPDTKAWQTVEFPKIKTGGIGERRLAFGVLKGGGGVSMVTREFGSVQGNLDVQTWHFSQGRFQQDMGGPRTITDTYTQFWLRDLDGDGVCEMVGASGKVHAYRPGEGWRPLAFNLPGSVANVSKGEQRGLRFADLDADGKLDVLFSNEKEYGVHLFEDMEKGWSRKVLAGKSGDRDALPMISRKGQNNGFWMHSGHLWWSNEDTVKLRDNVDRRPIKALLAR